MTMTYFLAWPGPAFPYLCQRTEHPVPAYLDLLNDMKTAVSTKEQTAQARAAAIAADDSQAEKVTETTTTFAAAIKDAQGSTVIDTTVVPFVEYTSTDGVTVVPKPVSGINDPLPTPPAPPEPPPAP